MSVEVIYRKGGSYFCQYEIQQRPESICARLRGLHIQHKHQQQKQKTGHHQDDHNHTDQDEDHCDHQDQDPYHHHNQDPHEDYSDYYDYDHLVSHSAQAPTGNRTSSGLSGYHYNHSDHQDYHLRCYLVQDYRAITQERS